jgi:hypothetical protein
MSRVPATVVLVVSLALLVCAPAASANGNLDIGTTFTPGVAASYSTSISSLSFKVPAGCPSMSAYIEVARDEQYDLDGTLYQGSTVDRFAAEETSAGVYEATTSGSWLQTPGAYYWQISGLAACDGGNATLWVGPAIGLTIKSATPTDPVPGSEIPDQVEILTLAQARASIPTIVKNVKRRIARGLKRNCTRGGTGDLTVVLCTVSWNDKLQYRYNGSFRVVLDDDGGIVSRFDGRRATLKCLKQRKGKDAKKCYKAHRFSYTLE